MKDVLVDTAVWSLAYRRSPGRSETAALELAELISEGRALLLGVVRQELLSGIRSAKQFEALRASLKAFPDVAVETDDYERAAAFCNLCRSRGVQGTTIDFLICAVASRRALAIFTTDGDFQHYARVLNLDLHVGRTAND